MPDIAGKLFPNLTTLIVQLLSTGVLLLIFKKFLWKNVMKYFAKRADYIESTINEAKEMNEKASTNLETAEKEARQAKDDGQKVKQQIIDQANEEARAKIEQAQKEIETEKKQAQADMKQEIVDVAIEVATKVMNKEMNEEINKGLVEEFVDDVVNYAESLFDLAKEENKVTQYLDDIKLVGEVLDSDPQIVQFFNHVLIENDKKIQLLDQSFKGNVDQYVLNFLKLLVQSRRIRYIDDIVKSYINLSNQYLGIEEGMIYTPYELTDQQIQDIEKAISQKENKKVTLKVSIDPSLLGGIKVQIANRIYDGTIKNKVEMLKKELLRK